MSGPDKVDLSIIIVNWNTRDLLHNCLASIVEHTDGLSTETIVVDNNSFDGSRQMVVDEFPQAALINSGYNAGFARANNLGVQKATAPLILFLNPDTEVLAGSLRGMTDRMASQPDVGALGCKIRNGDGDVQELGLQWFPSPLTELVRTAALSSATTRRLKGLLPYHDPNQSGMVQKLFGACLMVRRDVLDQVGSFDERFFMYCEDVDLCHRVLQGGWKLYYMSEVEILHLGGSASDTAPSGFSVLMMCESFSKFMRKHHGMLGQADYRMAALAGSLIRLCMLLALRLVRQMGGRRRFPDLEPSFQKYLFITRWALGLQRPVIKT